jgi:hypothetical protein
MYSKIKLDGVSITAVMGSTSEKMYLCQVPNFGLKIIKLRPGGWLACNTLKFNFVKIRGKIHQRFSIKTPFLRIFIISKITTPKVKIKFP